MPLFVSQAMRALSEPIYRTLHTAAQPAANVVDLPVADSSPRVPFRLPLSSHLMTRMCSEPRPVPVASGFDHQPLTSDATRPSSCPRALLKPGTRASGTSPPRMDMLTPHQSAGSVLNIASRALHPFAHIDAFSQPTPVRIRLKTHLPEPPRRSICGLPLPLPPTFDYAAHRKRPANTPTSDNMELLEKNRRNVRTETHNANSVSATRGYEEAEEKRLLVGSKEVVEATGPLPIFMTSWVAAQRLVVATEEATENVVTGTILDFDFAGGDNHLCHAEVRRGRFRGKGDVYEDSCIRDEFSVPSRPSALLDKFICIIDVSDDYRILAYRYIDADGEAIGSNEDLVAVR
ncbi:hypothetical protein B0H14DRAFT_3479799 [Mycena olivaceomarginata]|nr:hypothetical protein B0H14DRAFT_3479799 [Mycena olivaceomarginata]